MRLFYHPQEVSAMELKETLVYYRKRQGLSQIELAEELSVSRQTVSKWETGSALPSAENLLALSKLYGVSADALLNAERTEDVLEPALLPAPPSPPKTKRTPQSPATHCVDAGRRACLRPDCVLHGCLGVRRCIRAWFSSFYANIPNFVLLRHWPVLCLAGPGLARAQEDLASHRGGRSGPGGVPYYVPNPSALEAVRLDRLERSSHL